jgi:nitrous oxide reductase accessory protein NosL
VGRLTVIESTALALTGAIAGVVLYLVTSPLVGLIPFRGSPLGGAVLLAPEWVALVVAMVGVLAAISAVVGLRAVVVSPLGVRARQDAPRLHWIRAVGAVVVVGIAFAAVSALQVGATAVWMIFVVLGLGFGGTIAVLNLIGPWALRLSAKGQARRARTPRALLAARSVLESPKAAWRQVSGVAMTSFMAVFAGVGVSLLGMAGNDGDRETLLLLQDIRTGVLITVVASFLMVACSAGIAQAAAILDRRDLYVSLDRIGMPVAEMNAARGRAVLSPLRFTTVGSAVTAAVVVFPLTGMSLILSPLTLVVVAACLAAGILLVWFGLLATRPVLARVLAEPSPSL